MTVGANFGLRKNGYHIGVGSLFGRIEVSKKYSFSVYSGSNCPFTTISVNTLQSRYASIAFRKPFLPEGNCVFFVVRKIEAGKFFMKNHRPIIIPTRSVFSRIKISNMFTNSVHHNFRTPKSMVSRVENSFKCSPIFLRSVMNTLRERCNAKVFSTIIKRVAIYMIANFSHRKRSSNLPFKNFTMKINDFFSAINALSSGCISGFSRIPCQRSIFNINVIDDGNERSSNFDLNCHNNLFYGSLLQRSITCQ